MVVPSFPVATALTLGKACLASVGLVNPGMVNVMGWPAENVPDVNDTVKTNGSATLRAAVPPAPAAGAVNVTAALPEFARAMPAPMSVMMILPLLGIDDAGASVTVMVTDVALRALLLRVMAGALMPRFPTIAGYVPVTLVSIMVVPSFAVVTAATLVIAAWAAEGLVNPLMVNVMGWPAANVPNANDTVKTNGPAPLRAAVPCPGPRENMTLELPRAMPAPLSVMMILPGLGIDDEGVIATVMVTDVAPLITLLRVMAGKLLPRFPTMAGYVPVKLRPIVVPSLAVVAAATLVIAAWAAVGLVNPGMVNVMGWLAANVPDVNDTVKTNGPAPLRAAVPAGPPLDGEVNATAVLTEFARAMPAPLSVMMILPLLASVVTGVSVMLMVTDVAPRALLLRVMAGKLLPRFSIAMIAGYVPVTLDPTMVVPSLAVVAAATLEIAAWAAEGLVNPEMVKIIDCPPPIHVDVNVTVNTNGPAPLRAAVPDPMILILGVSMKLTLALPEFARAMPAPLSVMMILPGLETDEKGVIATLMVTDVVPLILLLRVMVGAKVPRDVPKRMAG
jgi:hypothetical protein